MKVTDVRVRKVDSEGKMRAWASVTFDDCFVVHNIKVLENERGLFVVMPSRRTPQGEYRDIAHPVKNETREMIQKAVLEVYNKD